MSYVPTSAEVIAVTNLKGGVGKTTFAINLTIALANRGRDVLLIDAEGTALAFTELRSQARPSKKAGYTAVKLEGANIKTQTRELKNKYAYIVIDIGGEDATGSMRAAFMVADLVVIPVKPRTFDFWRTQETVDLINEARQINEELRAVAFINEADPQGLDNAETITGLKALEGVEVPPFTIGRRKAIHTAETKGLGMLEYTDDPKATHEFKQLIDFLVGPCGDITVNRLYIGEETNGYRTES